ncbi:hypothetical protein Zmor_001274 [Zophobas morio]|uniref:Uncharacterized protein n=1 Tax=Zophobas morio TaxID=2755281 RepID=A0AA38J0U7_9CUCU|nr:hypothetical protein Zmor_001274 [Zophobas morio]
MNYKFGVDGGMCKTRTLWRRYDQRTRVRKQIQTRLVCVETCYSQNSGPTGPKRTAGSELTERQRSELVQISSELVIWCISSIRQTAEFAFIIFTP